MTWTVRRGVLSVVVVVTSMATLSTQVTSGAAEQLQVLENRATATEHAVRGRQTRVTPHPPIPYPAGRCDHLAPGLPGLSSTNHPSDYRLMGFSVQGREIWAEYWGPKTPASTVIVVGQIHGNECAPSLLVDQIRRNPPTSYGIWLIPTLNPDGYATYSRRNANGVDLNADGGAVSQPETQALFSFVRTVRPALTIHVHSPNGFVGAHPTGSPLATGLCASIGALPSLRCSFGGAGYRADRSRWFLWQGLQTYGGESLLIELRAVSSAEVPTARPRPPTLSVDAVRSEAARILAILDARL